MSEPTAPEYLPLWLTAEEHQALFAELLESTDPGKTRRLAEMLRKADTRAKDSTVRMTVADGRETLSTRSTSTSRVLDTKTLGARFTFRVMMLGMLFIAAAACLYSVFSSR
jgi:hypothetical protein